MLLRVVATVAGAALVVMIAHALVVDLLVPRPASSLLTRGTRSTMQAFISLTARLGGPYRRQHRLLSAMAPLVVVATLFLAVLGFLLGFALIIYGVTGRHFTEALLQSGSGLLTLGIVQVDDPVQIAITFVAAFTGMVIIAVLIGYLLLLFTAYTAREAEVTKSTVWAGEPAWGPELLCRRKLGNFGSLDPIREGWIDWVCAVRVAQTMYPTLSYFRSSGSMRGWVTTLLARLDAASLELAVAPERDEGALTSFIAEGCQTFAVMRILVEPARAVSLTDTLQPIPPVPAGADPRGSALFQAIRADGARTKQHRLKTPDPHRTTLTRADFDQAVSLLTEVGVDIVSDRDAAWGRFQRLRGEYEDNAYRVAYRVHSPPAPWSGDRRGELITVWPTSVAEVLRRGLSHG